MASGSFASPSSGFTYDQMAAPANPQRGQTWRERDANNDVVEEWFWNGTYWLSPAQHLIQRTDANSPPQTGDFLIYLPVYEGKFTSLLLRTIGWGLYLSENNSETDYWQMYYSNHSLGHFVGGSQNAPTHVNSNTKNRPIGVFRETFPANIVLIPGGQQQYQQIYLRAGRVGSVVTRGGFCFISVAFSFIRPF